MSYHSQNKLDTSYFSFSRQFISSKNKLLSWFGWTVWSEPIKCLLSYQTYWRQDPTWPKQTEVLVSSSHHENLWRPVLHCVLREGQFSQIIIKKNVVVSSHPHSFGFMCLNFEISSANKREFCFSAHSIKKTFKKYYQPGLFSCPKKLYNSDTDWLPDAWTP